MIRRASFDLIGLPPTPEEVAAFVKEYDATPQAAYKALLDRLLASPHYGERWGRHWLDVARYADNKGYVFFEDKQLSLGLHLPRLRDRGVQSRPAVRSVRAWSNSPPIDCSSTIARSLAALGFLTLGGHFMNNTHDIIDDRIDVVTRGLLGLTVDVRPLPRSQVRSDPDGRLLLALRRVPQLQRAARAAALGACPDTEADRKLAKELAEQRKEAGRLRHRQASRPGRAGVPVRANTCWRPTRPRINRPTDDFMLIADKGDLNPAMITRWRIVPRRNARSGRTRPGNRGISSPIFRRRNSPSSAAVVAALQQDKTINPLVRDALPASPLR